MRALPWDTWDLQLRSSVRGKEFLFMGRGLGGWGPCQAGEAPLMYL